MIVTIIMINFICLLTLLKIILLNVDLLIVNLFSITILNLMKGYFIYIYLI